MFGASSSALEGRLEKYQDSSWTFTDVLSRKGVRTQLGTSREAPRNAQALITLLSISMENLPSTCSRGGLLKKNCWKKHVLVL